MVYTRVLVIIPMVYTRVLVIIPTSYTVGIYQWHTWSLKSCQNKMSYDDEKKVLRNAKSFA